MKQVFNFSLAELYLEISDDFLSILIHCALLAPLAVKVLRENCEAAKGAKTSRRWYYFYVSFVFFALLAPLAVKVLKENREEAKGAKTSRR